MGLKSKNGIRRHQIHVFKKSGVCLLLVLIVVLQFWQWIVDDSRINSNQTGYKLQKQSSPLFKFEKRFFSRSAKVVEFFQKNLYEAKHTIKSSWSSSCPSECNSDHGWGICDETRCICNPGFGDTDCSFNLEVLYGHHGVYSGFHPRGLDASGWDMGGDLYGILVRSLTPNLVVEVGVWKGASALKLAQAVREQGSGVLVAVDTWLPVLEFWENHDIRNRMKDLHFQNGYPDVFHTFLGNVIHQNLTEVVIPFPATSQVAFDFFSRRKAQAELIHIDAAHEYRDVVLDINMWWQIVRNGGVLMGDDWSETWPGVVRAVRQHAKRYRLVINVFRNKWWIQKPLHYTSKT